MACGFAGSVGLLTAALPFSSSAPVGMALGLGIVGLALGAFLGLAGPATPRWVLHGTLVLASAAMCACVLSSTTDVGRVVTAYGYVWIALYAAWFHRRGALVLHLGGVAVGLAVALVASGAPSPVQTWIFVTASVLGVAAVLHARVVRLQRLADHDQLTGLINRGAFLATAERAMAQAERTHEPLALALIDLDGFKQVNDLHGHAAGDRLLAELAAAWSTALRRNDVLARLGGDEFVLLMHATTETAAHAVIERLAAAEGAGRWSAGVAGWRGEPMSAWLQRADAELYARKRVGSRT
jgi:diguanylate cyclase (GGDEF)-like protein